MIGLVEINNSFSGQNYLLNSFGMLEDLVNRFAFKVAENVLKNIPNHFKLFKRTHAMLPELAQDGLIFVTVLPGFDTSARRNP
jgi:hypothetical protein